MTMMSGACNCGAIAFELGRHPWGVIVCHCSICRRFTGNNGNSVVIIDNDDFRWLRGEELVVTWNKPGHDWLGCFCRTCGSQLPGDNGESKMYIPAGLISEGGDSLRVIHHIWVDSKANWDEIGDSGQQNRNAFEA